MRRCQQVMSAPHLADIAHDLVCEARGRECLNNRDCPLWDGSKIEGLAPLLREIRESASETPEQDLAGLIPEPRAPEVEDAQETGEGASSSEDAPS